MEFHLHVSDRGGESAAEPVLAVTGSRPHSKGHWKYTSVDGFVAAKDTPWGGLGLKAFKATSRAGVQEWLEWLVNHAPQTDG
jgi:hypothetical protein